MIRIGAQAVRFKSSLTIVGLSLALVSGSTSAQEPQQARRRCTLRMVINDASLPAIPRKLQALLQSVLYKVSFHMEKGSPMTDKITQTFTAKGTPSDQEVDRYGRTLGWPTRPKGLRGRV